VLNKSLMSLSIVHGLLDLSIQVLIVQPASLY
jgi:hypothetical protein